MTRRGSLVTVTMAAGMLCAVVPATALADVPKSITVSPTSGLPGATVSVQVACADDKIGTVDSDVLTVGALTRNPDGHQPWALFASGTVKAGAEAGQHTVSTVCGGEKVTATFTVAAVDAAVQLNADTAARPGRQNVYQFAESNLALGRCGPATGQAPASTRFSSPVLTFDGYSFDPMNHFDGNVAAKAVLTMGTAPGRYTLSINCLGKISSTTFLVPQVRQVPTGAPQTGGGGLAAQVDQ